MAKLKKLTKKKRSRLRRAGLYLALVLLGVLGGLYLGLPKTQTPGNLVWPIDDSVSVPDDLNRFLLSRDVCQDYNGAGQTGVGLWGVIQSTNNFAKLAYGCSVQLTSYVLALKIDAEWAIISPDDYFGDDAAGQLPKCSVVKQYNIPGVIESFCLNSKQEAVTNKLQ